MHQEGFALHCTFVIADHYHALSVGYGLCIHVHIVAVELAFS